MIVLKTVQYSNSILWTCDILHPTATNVTCNKYVSLINVAGAPTTETLRKIHNFDIPKNLTFLFALNINGGSHLYKYSLLSIQWLTYRRAQTIKEQYIIGQKYTLL